ncbi:MAG: type II toxin-antitoxin system PemK/MazF family toxin [Acidobacteria bacterium]|nr:type II toxin-antitoxin system PemK/MazF family toxin [Acidobacteriota bacterium]
MIRQGEIYWFDPGRPRGSAPALIRPHVVVQNDLLNASAIRTTILCALTTNLRRAGAPSNVLLEAGEAGLPERSVVNVTQIITVDKEDLRDFIGRLSPERIRQIAFGLSMILKP